MKPALRTGLLCVVASVVGGGVVWLFQGHTLFVLPAEIRYEDLIAVLLTGVTAVVAILALILAVLTFVGYTQFKKMVRNAVEQVTPRYLVKELKEGGSNQLLKEIVADLSQSIRENPIAATMWTNEKKAQQAELAELDRNED